MQTTWIDTSAFMAVLNSAEYNHTTAKDCWITLLERDTRLICNSYVLLETLVLIQKRLGLEAIRDFQQDIMPILQVEWLQHTQHSAAINLLFSINRRRLSLVDCASFETMRRLGIHQVFTFDKHFTEQGFEIIPQQT